MTYPNDCNGQQALDQRETITEAAERIRELEQQLSGANRINDMHRAENGRLRRELSELQDDHEHRGRKLERMRRELEAMRPVCEAAVAWREHDESPAPASGLCGCLDRLADAVDALSSLPKQKADAPKETGWLNPDGSYENRAGTYLGAAYVPEALRTAVAEAARPVNAADMDKVLRRAEKAERELAEVRDNGPKHTRECGTTYRGCSPDCTYQADVEALHEQRHLSSTPDAEPKPDLPRWSINHPDARPMEPEEVVGAALTAAIARAEKAERELEEVRGRVDPDKLLAYCRATFNGGHTGDECKAFHHGMGTVINVLRAALTPAQENDHA